jgi:hypothetical protein
MRNKPVPSSMPSGSDPGKPPTGGESFRFRQVAEIEPLPPERAWLIEQLWLNAAVGILGGHSKSYKTYLAAELSLAVASGAPALGCFPVSSRGPVLFYGAEDSLQALRSRFDGLATVRKLSLASLPIYLLDTPTIRLDRDNDLLRLNKAIESLKPRLLVLDPFVRLARIDENSSADVASVLASLRAIQRAHDLAVMVVHHARKSPASHPMNALRGSSDFAAWSDTNLYLARKEKSLTLAIQHRSAPSPSPLALSFEVDPAPHLVILNHNQLTTDLREEQAVSSLQEEILALLKRSTQPLSTTEIRDQLHKRKADVVEALKTLAAKKLIQRDLFGWQISTR